MNLTSYNPTAFHKWCDEHKFPKNIYNLFVFQKTLLSRWEKEDYEDLRILNTREAKEILNHKLGGKA